MTDADLAWHVRARGRWILARAQRELASSYPTYAEFQALTSDLDTDSRPIRLLSVDDDGVVQIEPLNAQYDSPYLRDPNNPRWVAKPTVAYLWSRTVACKNCRATVPLLKTRWLCKKDGKRVLLAMEPNSDQTGVVFDIEVDPPQVGGNAAQRREHDRRVGAGTMSRTGVTCPCCRTIMTMEDLRHEGLSGRFGQVMTAVVVEGIKGKEYRLPTDHELSVSEISDERLQAVYEDIPFGLPDEPLPSKDAPGFRVPLYGFDAWRKMFTNRQLLALGHFIKAIRQLALELEDAPEDWREAIIANLALTTDRLADYSSSICSWHNSGEKLGHTFARFALPMVWDFTEVNPLSNSSGNYLGALDWVSRSVAHGLEAARTARAPSVQCQSAIRTSGDYDLIITDPPYYDAIPYSDLMDFFHIWLRRSTHGICPEIDAAFRDPLGPKWDHEADDGELVDDSSRFNGDEAISKRTYEDGMYRAFRACNDALKTDGRLVVVFANKQPAAWETLVGALIRAGFVVDGSWPIQTEMGNRTRAMGSAALSSSVWLVCKKRAPARPGWDNVVLEEMRRNITQQLRDFWDAGVRGPDFVWAATGPALEAFSKYPVVRKANSPAPDEMMTVSEFLREVRRMVVDFVVGRVLTQDGEEEVTSLDDVTTYYLLHRHDFGVEGAPVGACILYALSCNVSDSALVNQHDLLVQSGRSSNAADLEDGESEEEADSSGGGANVKLKPWHRRNGRNLGLEVPGGRSAPLIDQVHRLMHLWKAGDQVRVNQYLDERGLLSSALFNQLLQALIELAPAGSEERSVLESISNHCANRGDVRAPRQQQWKL